jgi:filamentous hemagglutinin family protein
MKKKVKIKYLMSYGLTTAVFSIVNVQAEVILDGSLGRNENLMGPNFAISADLGRQVGDNLFHSFQTFNLNQSETATFTGPDQVKNVINRVTGGTVSTIDGTLRSLMPQADFYFLNPAGIIIGEHAQLDVPGSVHLSTADVLRLEDGGQFAATHPQTSLLTVAPPSAFGFLSDSPAKITLAGSQLSVSDGKTLSVIGGDIDIQPNSLLKSVAGRLNLVSVASRGDVVPTLTGLDLDQVAQRGYLMIDTAKLDVTGNGDGSIYIRAGQFVLDNSEVLGQTIGDQDAGIIDIAAIDLTLLQKARISNSTQGAGRGGHIVLNIDNALTVSGSGDLYSLAGLFANALEGSVGNAGMITINAKTMDISNSTQIANGTFGSGQGGKISIHVADSVTLSSNAGILASSEVAEGGDAGEIFIAADNLTMKDGAQITSLTTGKGQGGTVTLNIKDTISLIGIGNQPSAIGSVATGQQSTAGQSGTIDLTTKHLHIREGAAIASAAYPGHGQGGNIHINATDSVTISGSDTYAGEKTFSIITAESRSTKNAGKIVVNTPLLSLSDDGRISTAAVKANAGHIEINVAQLQLSNGAIITSENEGIGDAGHISLRVIDRIQMENAQVTTKSVNVEGGGITIQVPQLLHLLNSEITTDVQKGVGNGGNITIDKPAFVVLNRAKIKADAHGGNGGNITIVSDEYMRSIDSRVTASSKLGTPGEIKITALETDLSGSLLGLPTNLFNIGNQLQSPCSARLAEKMSSFILVHSEGGSNALNDLLPSGPLLSTPAVAKTKTFKNKEITKKSYQTAAIWLTGCRP